MSSKNQWRNAFWGLISTTADIICGLYTSRLLLNTFGASSHGLINAINNLLGLIISLEFVFFVFSRKSYYLPLEQKQKEQLSNLYHRDKRSGLKIAIIATITTIIISLIYPLFYLDQFSYWDTALLVFALGLYILVKHSNRTDVGFLNADNRNYIVKILATFTTILTAVLCYFFVKWGYSLRTIKVMVALVLLIHPIFYLIYIRVHYQLPRQTTKLPPLTLDPFPKWTRIVNVILNNRIDILILTIVATLTDVSIYAVYAMVGKYLAHCVNALFEGRENIYGYAFVHRDTATAKRAYAHTQFYLANVLAITFGIGIIMLNPFVRLYTKFVRGVNYSQFWFGFFMLIAQMLTCIRYAQMKFIYSTGRIDHKRILFDTIMEAVINLVISIILVFPFGITGVAIGTIISYLYTIVRLFNYRQKKIVKTSIFNALRRYLPTIIVITVATFTAVNNPPIPMNKIEWLRDCVLVALVIIPLNLVLNLILNPIFRQNALFFTKKYFRKCFRKIRKNTKYFSKKSSRFIKNTSKHISKSVKNTFKHIAKCIRNIFKKIYKFIRNRIVFVCKALGAMRQRGIVSAIRTYFRHQKATTFEMTHQAMDDAEYLTKLGEILLGQKMDLINPQTLNEKINWLKIYGQREIYTMMSDKAVVKDYVAKTLGDNYVIPTYGVWDSFDAIDWNSLPNSFVLKCTHDSGSIYVVPDKTKLDLKAARLQLEQRLQSPYWCKMRENGYQFVPPRIIAEKYLPGLGHRNSVEYKFTCFNGKVVFGTICQGYAHGFAKRRVNDFYTPDFQHLPMRAWYHNAHRRPKKPAQWEEMIAISERFAQNIPYLRVDLYVEDGQIYFGEFTFYTGGGFIEFHPHKMDLILGQQLTLPDPTTPPAHPVIKPITIAPNNNLPVQTPAVTTTTDTVIDENKTMKTKQKAPKTTKTPTKPVDNLPTDVAQQKDPIVTDDTVDVDYLDYEEAMDE